MNPLRFPSVVSLVWNLKEILLTATLDLEFTFLVSLGDGRASEQPGLTAIHTIWLREHNRIVEGLKGVNPHWDAELLFEHTRRIVTAELTHIIYNEFLPRLLSWNAVNLYGLKLLPAGKWYFANQLKYFMKIIITMNPAQLNCIPRKRKSNSTKYISNQSG